MIKSDVSHRFGDKLRAIRERKGITLKIVAEKAKVSESLVSQIERNRVSPSIDTLLAIADVLEIDIDYLFKDYRRTKKVNIVRSDENKTISTPDAIYRQLSLLGDHNEEHSLEAFIIEIRPGNEKGSTLYGHRGKELGYVLEGSGELRYGHELYEINTGDCVSFSSDIPHILKNTGDDILKALWVITPPKMFIIND